MSNLYFIVKRDTLEVLTAYYADSIREDYPKPYGDMNIYTHVVGNVINGDCVKASIDNEGNITIIDDEVKLEGFNKYKFSILRNERNKLLTATDWTQIPDTSLTEEQKEQWKVYRQALRDLPNNTVDPSNPVWPEKPFGSHI